jgi:DNA-binding NarL/FixJ family response regulator
LRGPLPERYPANISTQAKARLVVVHDDELLRSALQGLLKAVGLQAQAFPWAEEFLKSGVQHQTACLIADIRMPGMSGVELQANAFFSTKPQGAGMGLPISRSVMESHDDRLWATASSGRGATFQFTLPSEVKAHQAA